MAVEGVEAGQEENEGQIPALLTMEYERRRGLKINSKLWRPSQLER